MSVPDYQSLMLPLLSFAAGKDEFTTGEAVEALAQELGLTEDDLHQLLPSGSESRFANRVGWAATYMKKAGLLENTRRAHFRITARGYELLRTKPNQVNVKLLRQYPEFVEFQQLKGTRSAGRTRGDAGPIIDVVPTTPSESLEAAYDNLRRQLAGDLLSRLKQTSPAFFERAVVELLVRMGYGGSRADAGKAIGRSGDGGIDGIINEDRLGLDVVYIQAKRWDTNPVGRPEVMQFAGALEGQRASKGIFITTSRFTDDALGYVARINRRIILIDGDRLTDLMIEHDVGVSTVALYPVKKINSDFFEESL